MVRILGLCNSSTCIERTIYIRNFSLLKLGFVEDKDSYNQVKIINLPITDCKIQGNMLVLYLTVFIKNWLKIAHYNISENAYRIIIL